MREIKFRAWDKLTEKFVTAQYLSENLVRTYQEDSSRELLLRGSIFTENGLELMQYTGLKDKNGVDIYEFDLVRSERGYKTTTAIGVVSWYDGYCGFQVDFKDDGPLGRLDERLEVIGNIYEHPELLK